MPGTNSDTNAGNIVGLEAVLHDASVTETLEGGRDAWMSLAGSFLVYFASFGVINSFGAFQTFYQTVYLRDSPPLAIAFIGTLQLALMYLTSPVIGSLFDIYGTKYLYPIGGAGCALSLLLLSFTQPNHIWQQILSQGILFGLTVGCGVQPSLAVVGQYFKKRRALAMGLVATGSSAGGVCFPIMVSNLVPRIGFAWTTRIAALIIVFCYTAAFLLTRVKSKPSTLKSLRDLVDFSGFKDPRYACLAVASLVVNLGLYAPYYYLEPYCVLLDPATNIKQYLLPILNASSFAGRIIGGQLADTSGRLNTLYPMTMLSGLLCLTLWLEGPNIQSLVAFASLYGFCSGIFISVMPAATGQIVPDEKLGAQLGALSSLTAIATLVGNPIAGALIKEGGSLESYRAMVVYSGTTLLAGGLLLLVGRALHGKNLLAKW